MKQMFHSSKKHVSKSCSKSISQKKKNKSVSCTSELLPPLGTVFVWPEPPGVLLGTVSHLLAQRRHSASFFSFKGPRRVWDVSSHFLLMLWLAVCVCRGRGRVGRGSSGGTLPAPRCTATADNGSSRVTRCHRHSWCFSATVHRPLLMVGFSREQQGSINEQPLSIRS